MVGQQFLAGMLTNGNMESNGGRAGDCIAVSHHQVLRAIRSLRYYSLHSALVFTAVTSLLAPCAQADPTTADLLASWKNDLQALERVRLRLKSVTYLTGEPEPRLPLQFSVYQTNFQQWPSGGKASREYETVVSGTLKKFQSESGRSEIIWLRRDDKTEWRQVLRTSPGPQFDVANAKISVFAEFNFPFLTPGLDEASIFFAGYLYHLRILESLEEATAQPVAQHAHGFHVWIVPIASDHSADTIELMFDFEAPHALRGMRWQWNDTDNSGEIKVPDDNAMRIEPAGLRSHSVEVVLAETMVVDETVVPSKVKAMLKRDYGPNLKRTLTKNLEFFDVVIDKSEPAAEQLVFLTEIPNGTPVRVQDDWEIAYVWQDGRIVKAAPPGLLQAVKNSEFSASRKPVRWLVWSLGAVALLLLALCCWKVGRRVT